VLIRLRLRDSPLFEELEQKQQILQYPASKVWKEKTGLILHLSMLNAGIGAAFWLNQVFGVSYMSLTGIPTIQASLANVYAAIVAMFFMYTGGVLADRIGRRMVF